MASLDIISHFAARQQPRFKLNRLYFQTGPVVIFLVALFIAPVVTLLALSFLDNHNAITLTNYQRLIEVPLYGRVLLATVKIAFFTTVFCLAAAYPVAYLLTMSKSSTRNWLIILVLMPFWTSVLVKTFAWFVILGKKGALNQILQAYGIIDAPLQLIYNFTGIMVGMTHALIPVAAMTLLSVMERVDPNLSKAAATMGAKPGTRFWRIYFPLTMPGVASAGLLVFISSLGFYVTPALLGGPQDTMIVQLIVFQIREVLNWPFAGAIGVLLVLTFMVIFYFYDKVFGLSVVSGDGSKETSARTSMLRNAGSAFGARICCWLGSLTDAAISLVPRRVGRSAHVVVNHGRLLKLVCALIFCFLVLPTLFVVPVSFTSEAFLTWPPKLFSLKWYVDVLHSPIWLDAAARSFGVAVASALMAMLFALPCAFALARKKFAGKQALFGLVVAPMIVPNIFVAVGLFFLFSRIGIAGTTLAVILGHTVIVIPYVVVTLLAVVRGYDQNLDHAAATMGASPRQIFSRITFPVLRSGIIAAFMFAFIVSFDELTIALFVTGGRVATLPKLMYEDALLSVSPRLAAVATLLLVFMTIIIAISEIIRRRGRSYAAQH